MTQEKERFDWWTLPAMGLWVVFFLLGLAPRDVFLGARIAGQVTTQGALVNSEWVITLGMSAYLAWFTHARCRENGLSPQFSRGLALQLGLAALLAFMPLGILDYAAYLDSGVPGLRFTFMVFMAAKLLPWIALYAIILRYYFIDGIQAFRAVPAVFPSVRAAKRDSQASEDKPDETAMHAAEDQIAKP